MLRSLTAVFPLLALTLAAGAASVPHAAEGAARGRPVPGENFTLAEPALAMIWVAPGTFLMSSTHGAGDDTRVTFTRGYWLGQTEVTQSQWRAVMDYFPLPSRFKGSEHPVEQVGWATAMSFCARLTERERAAGRLPEGYEYSLPTEAQWEYACRAGTTGIYAGDLDAMAWYQTNSNGQTQPVAQKQPNAWGFFDMHGNVREWCADWYGAYAGGGVGDPTGVATGQFRVYRGGAWFDSAGGCRAALRGWGAGSPSDSGSGFRIALAPLRPSAQVTDQLPDSPDFRYPATMPAALGHGWVRLAQANAPRPKARGASLR